MSQIIALKSAARDVLMTHQRRRRAMSNDCQPPTLSRHQCNILADVVNDAPPSYCPRCFYFSLGSTHL